MTRFTQPVLVMILALAAICPAFSQSFTRITSGAIVNDGGHSIGCSWADMDGDGDFDLYVTNGIVNGSEANFLYRNDGNGDFTRLTGVPAVQDEAFSESSSWGDFNNDGLPDLYVGNSHWGGTAFFDFLFVNNAATGLQRISGGALAAIQADSRSISWVDYDNDGRLDLFVANEAGRNFLWRNQGDSSFANITAGALTSDLQASAGCGWADYDLDGDMDLFVANMGQNNSLYRNDGQGSFARILTGDIVSNGGNSIGCSWGDYNNDGYPDLFVANFNGQNNFLYRNNTDGSFTRIISGDIISNGGNSFGSCWGDYDNDGFSDLFVANLGNQNNFLYHNNGDGTFSRITTGDIVTNGGQSEGCAWADYDNDGDLDLYVVNFEGQNNFLYRNEGTANNWLSIRLSGEQSNRSAIGARVGLKTAAGWQYREVSAQTGYQSQNSMDVSFGLGAAVQADSLIINWPSGSRSVFTAVGAGQAIRIRENGELTGLALPDVPAKPSFQLEANYPNPFNPETSIAYTLVRPEAVRLAIYDLLGREITRLEERLQSAGRYTVRWDGRDSLGREVSTGIYLYRLSTGAYSSSRRMLLLR